MIGKLAIALIVLGVCTCWGQQLKTADIRVRDPFIHADKGNKTYYMYVQAANRAGSGFAGVEAYASKDLVNWSKPVPVLKLPVDRDVQKVWAPEMHAYNGRYYLFVTLTLNKVLSTDKPVKKDKWPTLLTRGTHVFHADTPLGPFKPFKPTSHTPTDWMALDGTLFVEDGVPHMVFCHEWVQLIDGTMDVVRLKPDLSGTIGEPETLFKASDAPNARRDPERGKITDGCFLYRSQKSGRLFMIWSTFIPGKDYCVALTHSESGKIAGPWTGQKIIYGKNGGHGMIFKTFDGRLLMTLHQPNSSGKERLHLFELIDNGDTLIMGKEVELE
ncbi:MAG: glycoside hydrolase family 43 protein [Kiritimatiellales bacterium]|nr:glycoside hydrolase family 43 protein [Kiritimatiellales bacterium]